ncbi:uncharacterized protein MYCFIDRAFT_171335 [Pseudocercospora fijiensis CIRAD86]|uniref:Uncharacterized protein n=1 Tax=Pseudocercospora fijiensis (strain CIRAD86) TaxID=383855 RepID=M3A2K6_PSEFD|nr:uncharacterized protein MYCFIDRAFT_171335 [Pseudocercospora fijiensis CIRAD86]EME85409.1 hypothetical protein MYCFIDRAFT_171335 [Pseudocercospora fijiensis CIRAD86]
MWWVILLVRYCGRRDRQLRKRQAQADLGSCFDVGSRKIHFTSPHKKSSPKLPSCSAVVSYAFNLSRHNGLTTTPAPPLPSAEELQAQEQAAKATMLQMVSACVVLYFYLSAFRSRCGRERQGVKEDTIRWSSVDEDTRLSVRDIIIVRKGGKHFYYSPRHQNLCEEDTSDNMGLAMNRKRRSPRTTRGRWAESKAFCRPLDQDHEDGFTPSTFHSTHPLPAFSLRYPMSLEEQLRATALSFRSHSDPPTANDCLSLQPAWYPKWPHRTSSLKELPLPPAACFGAPKNFIRHLHLAADRKVGLRAELLDRIGDTIALQNLVGAFGAAENFLLIGDSQADDESEQRPDDHIREHDVGTVVNIQLTLARALATTPWTSLYDTEMERTPYCYTSLKMEYAYYKWSSLQECCSLQARHLTGDPDSRKLQGAYFCDLALPTTAQYARKPTSRGPRTRQAEPRGNNLELFSQTRAKRVQGCCSELPNSIFHSMYDIELQLPGPEYSGSRGTVAKLSWASPSTLGHNDPLQVHIEPMNGLRRLLPQARRNFNLLFPRYNVACQVADMTNEHSEVSLIISQQIDFLPKAASQATAPSYHTHRIHIPLAAGRLSKEFPAFQATTLAYTIIDISCFCSGGPERRWRSGAHIKIPQPDKSNIAAVMSRIRICSGRSSGHVYLDYFYLFGGLDDTPARTVD